MAFEFVVDTKIKNRAYPALAQWQARPYTQAWREFGEHWPWTTPLRIEEYCQTHDIAINLYTKEDYPAVAWYPICLGFFDFEIDYLALLPDWCVEHLKQKQLRLLFMYHEGDNPQRIKRRLDTLCRAHDVDRTSYVFVSANSSAAKIKNFVVFHDFELWYHQRNKPVDPMPVANTVRQHEFLCLCRNHKSWRSAVMADLHRHQLLEQSLWSYCNSPDKENFTDCALQIDRVPQLRYATKQFLEKAPHYADDFSDHDRNDHSKLPSELFADTYCNIVLESQFDVDGSGGVFLTEKTFKAIKHGQMFFIVGAAGSLAVLRNLGYQVFDDLLDNSYDLIEDPTHRWLALRDAIASAKATGLHDLYQRAIPQLEHNQQLFMRAPGHRLNTLMQTLESL